MDAVVGVRDESLRVARLGLVWSLCLVLVLVAIHANWKTFGTFVAAELIGGTFIVVREVLKFRTQLDGAGPLPSEAVEITRRPRQSRWNPRQVLLAVAFTAAAIGGLVAVALADDDWAPRLVAASIAVAIAHMLVRPLAEAHLVSRWERAHGRGRLFRRVGTTGEDHEQELYVADRAVPAA